MADTPHILKNLRNHLTKGHTILIPDEYVQKYNLPTRKVSISAIKNLHKNDTENKLKAGRAAQRKMKLGLACRLLDHSVVAAIKYLVEQGDMKKEALTLHGSLKRYVLHSTAELMDSQQQILDFKMALHLITMSQFFRPSRSGSYDVDDSVYLAQFVASQPADAPSEEEDELPNWTSTRPQ
ncbi:hypothetical protein HPB47_021660 [Ixodes persulcatus]|uniref:Uncharacterized protein n=1 Tax=Ixodes persulcatus TaxID=34615 RepID=A0AC60QC36_IXOPE|nr:hypothetical protein HPB47_021660 [Ixodes persulcatus]